MSDQIQFIADTIQNLDRKFEEFRLRVEQRFDEGSTRMGQLEFGMRELNQREKERNGKIVRLTDWMKDTQMSALRSAERAAMKAEARESATAFAKRIWGVIEKPVLLAIGLGILAGTAMATEGLVGLLQW